MELFNKTKIVNFNSLQVLTDRRKTEFKNRFNEAYTFFENIGLTNAIIRLKDLEVQFFMYG